MKIEEELSITLGTVTPGGLKVGESIFTSQFMLKQKWFEKADYTGHWNVPVLMLNSNPDEIYLIEINITDRAYRIAEEQFPKQANELDDYYLRLQLPKERFFRQHP
jgi:hypothetical protein